MVEEGLGLAERREKIVAFVSDLRFARVADLADHFGVSAVTIRTDLEELESSGRLDRVRGGAVARALPTVEHPYVRQLGAHAAAKEAIARAAAELVHDGASVFLDAGTTTTALANHLARNPHAKGVSILTNALPVALALEPVVGTYHVIVTGGTLRPLQHSLVNPMASLVIDRLHVDVAFLGCTGVDVDSGITNVNLPEAEVKQQLHAMAARTIVLADSSKVGVSTLARVCAIDDVDVLITDEGVDPAQRARLADRDVHCRYVDVP